MSGAWCGQSVPARSSFPQAVFCLPGQARATPPLPQGFLLLHSLKLQLCPHFPFDIWPFLLLPRLSISFLCVVWRLQNGVCHLTLYPFSCLVFKGKLCFLYCVFCTACRGVHLPCRLLGSVSDPPSQSLQLGPKNLYFKCPQHHWVLGELRVPPVRRSRWDGKVDCFRVHRGSLMLPQFSPVLGRGAERDCEK